MNSKTLLAASTLCSLALLIFAIGMSVYLSNLQMKVVALETQIGDLQVAIPKIRCVPGTKMLR